MFALNIGDSRTIFVSEFDIVLFSADINILFYNKKYLFINFYK